MIIAKTFTFESAHKLPDEEIYGACSNLHGHTYELLVEIEGQINDKGWVMNFKDLKSIIQEKVIKVLDHKYLNDIIPLPTAENIVLWIFGEIAYSFNVENKKIHSLTLYETKTSYAKIISQ